MNDRSTFFHRAGAIAGLFLLIALSRPVWSQLKQEPVPPPAPRAPANQENRPMSGQNPAEVAGWIDREIQQQLDAAKIPVSPVADDAEFCRRAHLDIIGRIPSLDRVKSFLGSQEPDKRQKLIDELLASPEYGEHFGKIWSDLIVRQEVIDYRLVPSFTETLANSFNENQGWDRIVSGLLTAQGTSRENPRIVYYLATLDQGQPAPEKITVLTARLFLGIQLECAQCHTHPFVRKWKRDDFWGMSAFFSHTRDVGDVGEGGDRSGKPIIAEGDGPPRGKMAMGNKPYPAPLPGAVIAMPDRADPTKTAGVVKARFLEGETPALEDRGPFRPSLAAWLTAADNPYFARAAVNRLWAHFFARGLVHPLDDLDNNEPSHPALLQQLIQEFTASGFDQKHLIRCLCNSQSYQRTSRPIAGNAKDARLYSHAAIKVMTPPVLLNSLATATGRKMGGEQHSEFIRLFGMSRTDEPMELGYGMPHYLRLLNLFKGEGDLVSRAVKPGASPQQVIEDLYRAALSRKPSASEVELLSDYVAKQKDARSGYIDVASALLNSAEFLFNH